MDTLCIGSFRARIAYRYTKTKTKTQTKHPRQGDAMPSTSPKPNRCKGLWNGRHFDECAISSIVLDKRRAGRQGGERQRGDQKAERDRVNQTVEYLKAQGLDPEFFSRHRMRPLRI